MLRCQDVAAQGIVHHVRLEVAAQRMLHDRALVEPRDQLGHIPEPGAAHRDDGERERDSSDAGPALQIVQLSDQTGAVPPRANEVSNEILVKGQAGVIIPLINAGVAPGGATTS